MSLMQALSSSIAGLRIAQSGLSLVAANVANAETPGYVRKTLAQTATSAGASGVSVRLAGIDRALDRYVQRQLRAEISGGAYAALRADYYARLQDIIGVPGGEATLETAFSNFTTSLQALATSPQSATARLSVLNAAQGLTARLNHMTEAVQGLRGDAELGIADATVRANNAISEIAALNRQLAGRTSDDAASALLMDRRDTCIDELLHLMDIRVVESGDNQVGIFTGSGIQLVGAEGAQLAFDAQGTVNATSQWNADPAQRTLGTLTLVSANGAGSDLIADKAFRSGEIAALVSLRDDVLVQMQRQLDAFAAAMASALSDVQEAGVSAMSGAQAGFDIDTGDLLPGNVIHLSYVDAASGDTRRIDIVRMEGPGLLPLPAAATASLADEVIGVDFSGGMGAVVAALNGRFGGLVFSNPTGTVLRVLDDGSGAARVDALSATRTLTSLDAGQAALPFFTDGGLAYSGVITAATRQSTGFAGRISVNPALLADVSKLVSYQADVASGDATRADFIHDQMTQAALAYLPDAAIGSPQAPFSGSLTAYLRQVIAFQGAMAENAAALSEGQQVVVNALQSRLADESAVNIDVEMAHLLNLQAAYGANARVMSTVKEMLDMLMTIGA